MIEFKILTQTVLGDTFCCNSIQILSTRSLQNESYKMKYVGEYKMQQNNSNFVVYNHTQNTRTFLVHGTPKRSNSKMKGWRVNSNGDSVL